MDDHDHDRDEDNRKRRQAQFEWARLTQYNEQHRNTTYQTTPAATAEEHTFQNHTIQHQHVNVARTSHSYDTEQQGFNNHIQRRDQDQQNIESLIHTLQQQSQINAFTLNNISIEQLLRMQTAQSQYRYQNQQQLTQNASIL